MRTITKAELQRANGKEGAPTLVACNGKVYDVSRSFLWQRGEHQVIHRAGGDLTDALSQAPHGAEFLERFPLVAVLAED